MSNKESKSEKTARQFLELAAMAYVEPAQSKILQEVSDEQVIVFHVMHNKFKRESGYKTADELDQKYPFVRVDGRWFVSIPKLYVYLFTARMVIAKSEHVAMVALYNGIQRASRYFDEYKSIDKKLTPHDHVNLEDYQEKMAELYKNYLMEQRDIFANWQTPVL